MKLICGIPPIDFEHEIIIDAAAKSNWSSDGYYVIDLQNIAYWFAHEIVMLLQRVIG